MYSSVLPLSQRPDGQYKPTDTVDFVLDYAGRQILPGSFRISGNLTIRVVDARTGNPRFLNGTDKIYIDSACGAHACFQQYKLVS